MRLYSLSSLSVRAHCACFDEIRCAGRRVAVSFRLEFCPPSLRGPDGRQTACIASAAAFERKIIYVSPRLSVGTDWFERKIICVITSPRLSTGTAWSRHRRPLSCIQTRVHRYSDAVWFGVGDCRISFEHLETTQRLGRCSCVPYMRFKTLLVDAMSDHCSSTCARAPCMHSPPHPRRYSLNVSFSFLTTTTPKHHLPSTACGGDNARAQAPRMRPDAASVRHSPLVRGRAVSWRA